jgi:monovalent cation:H+ antiporter-2, CPA2 family
MHDLSVILTLTGGLAAALVFGAITRRLGLSSLVGYLLAGIAVGPHTPGFVADGRIASQMADIGVILLMFGVGMHFHPAELLRVWRVALPGAAMQCALTATAGWGCARLFGWSHGAAAVFGLALAVASTVVLTRMLVERDRLTTHEGHVAVGWLIVQDLFAVMALVLLPVLASDQADATAAAGELVEAIAKVVAFAVLVWALGTRLFAPLMERIARMQATELFTLTVLVVALGVAVIAAEVFNVSLALGAFFGGLVVGESRFGHQAAADLAPFRDAFSALFFVSVGMLFDPALLHTSPKLLLSALGVILVVTPLAVLMIALVLGERIRTSLSLAVGLAQIGEFSFILAVLGRSLGVLPSEGMDTLVAAAIVSIAVNPVLFRLVDRLEARLGRTPAVVPSSEHEATTSGARPIVAIAGLGELGRRLARRCAESGISVSAIDNRLEWIEELRLQGLAATFGDPSRQEVLKGAGVGEARIIVVTGDSLGEKMRVCIAARQINPRISIIGIASSAAERAWLEEFGAALVYNALGEASEALLAAIRRTI